MSERVAMVAARTRCQANVVTVTHVAPWSLAPKPKPDGNQERRNHRRRETP